MKILSNKTVKEIVCEISEGILIARVDLEKIKNGAYYENDKYAINVFYKLSEDYAIEVFIYGEYSDINEDEYVINVLEKVYKHDKLLIEKARVEQLYDI